MKTKDKYIEDYEDDDDILEEGEIRLKFRLIKSKVNRNPNDFALIIKEKYVTENVQFEGRSCVRILCSSPGEHKAFGEFCKTYLGDFPSKSPYVYIPKDVLMPQPQKKKKSLFKD